MNCLPCVCDEFRLTRGERRRLDSPTVPAQSHCRDSEVQFQELLVLQFAQTIGVQPAVTLHAPRQVSKNDPQTGRFQQAASLQWSFMLLFVFKLLKSSAQHCMKSFLSSSLYM